MNLQRQQQVSATGINRFKARQQQAPNLDTDQSDTLDEVAKKLQKGKSIIGNPNSLMNRSKSLSEARNSLSGQDQPPVKSANSQERKKQQSIINVPKLANKSNKMQKDNKKNTIVKKKQNSVNLSHMMFQPVNNLVKERELTHPEITTSIIEEESYDQNGNQVTNQSDNSVNATDKLNEIMNQFERKLDSAHRKFVPAFGGQKKEGDKEQVTSDDKPVSSFNVEKGRDSIVLIEGSIQNHDAKTQKKLNNSGGSNNHTAKTVFGSSEQTAAESLATPSTTTRANKFQLVMETPNQFQMSSVTESRASANQSTDEQGNRSSILPTKSRPKATAKILRFNSKEKKTKDAEQPIKKPSILEKLKTENELQKEKPLKKGATTVRDNYVRMNVNNYKPRLRGEQFKSKIMAKKTNSVKAKARFARKMQIEQAQQRSQVNSYGGLAKVGFDYEDREDEGEEETVPAFSSERVKQAALKSAKSASAAKEDINIANKEAPVPSEELLCSNFDEMNDELENIDEQFDAEEEEINPIDQAAYQIPDSDEGFKQILKEKFGHDDFLEGQLQAIKVMLHEKENVLVVLATGGGKSLIYQYTTQFMTGLVLVVTPLISLMTDQLGKLPDFIPGAAINSQQTYQTKRKVMKAIQDGHIKVLFITPERLFMEDLSKFGRKISMVCVDEIHCASEWSHNFRPAYLMLHEMIKEKLGSSTRVIGLTATATKSTQKQICKIFNVKYPDHLVTLPDLSRLNLQLSITRDNEKTKALMQLLKSDGFKKLNSILIFATARRTTEQIAQYLTQYGIKSSAYHAGKSDQERTFIQKSFIGNQIKVLCCTIAFSMGIDKSDIQSVIHYDLPRSIENYVQEIGRAGRDGKLARCHMFLNNEDFYQLRRITLSDLLDSQSAFRLTNSLIVAAKRQLYKILNPEAAAEQATKKRKRKDMQGAETVEAIIEQFEHESEIQNLYSEHGGSKCINLADVYEMKEQDRDYLYATLDVKELVHGYDLKKEVLLTMFNSLEKIDPEHQFFKLEAVLPASIGIRMHSRSLEELAEQDDFYQIIKDISKEFQGVYRCSLIQLADKLDVKPYNVPKILYQYQHNKKDEMTYDIDADSFVLRVTKIPSPSQTIDLAKQMLENTRKVENSLVSKLNCAYLIGRQVSLPSVEAMLKKEKLEDNKEEFYRGFSVQLNTLINKYFANENEEDMEIEIAGTEQDRNDLMPLLYIDSHREKSALESEIKLILKNYHHGTKTTHCIDPNNRMKPLDVTKVLMGISSVRENVKRFSADHQVWARRQDYAYEDILKVAESTVGQYYCEQLALVNNSTNSGVQNSSTLVTAPQAKKKL